MRLLRPLLSLALLSLAAALPGCSSVHEFDEGTICLADPAAPTTFVAGGDLELKVILDPCMGCADSFTAGCSVSQDGDRLILDAHGEWTQKGGAVGCAAVCLELSATCVVRDLPAGTYTIESGSNSIAVTLPSATPFTQPDGC